MQLCIVKIHSQLKQKKMKTKLHYVVIAMSLLLFPIVNYSQAPALGTAADFILFSTDGPVDMTSINHLTGNVGTNNGTSTNFENINGQVHDADGTSAQCAADLLIAYNLLSSTVPDFFPSSLLGNGDTLVPGVYAIDAAATLNLDLYLNAQDNADAVFIFQIAGPLSTNAGSQIKLINGALACNVFWKVEGLVDMTTGTSMKGTIIANNAAIIINTGSTLEGRALSTAGAITVDGILGYTPVGCGSPSLSGPTAPTLGGAACFAIFSTDGDVYNSGITTITGDVGTNVGSATGYDPLLVTGFVHPIPDGATAQCASDLLLAYNYVNTLAYDIELLYPVKLGNSLVLTPHTYLMNAAAHLTDTLFLNAQGNADAVFVILINGALTSSTYAQVVLTNLAQSKNVFWKIEGAFTLNNYSSFCGTVICNNGALCAVNTGVILDGRLLTTTGALTTTAIDATATMIPGNCATLNAPTLDATSTTEKVTFTPNPFSDYTSIILNDESLINNAEIRIFDAFGKEVANTVITRPITTFEANMFSKGMYFYNVIINNKSVQSGKLISQ